MNELHTRASVTRHEQIQEAWRLALLGDTKGARRILQALDQRALPVEAADLLARLAVREGCFEEARELWTAILEVAPTHEPSARALACLDSPWLFRAVCGQLVRMLVCVSGASLAAIGGWTLLLNIPDGHLSALSVACLAIMVAVFLAGVGVWVVCAARRANRTWMILQEEDSAAVRARRALGMTVDADSETDSRSRLKSSCARVPDESPLTPCAREF